MFGPCDSGVKDSLLKAPGVGGGLPFVVDIACAQSFFVFAFEIEPYRAHFIWEQTKHHHSP